MDKTCHAGLAEPCMIYKQLNAMQCLHSPCCVATVRVTSWAALDAVCVLLYDTPQGCQLARHLCMRHRMASLCAKHQAADNTC